MRKLLTVIVIVIVLGRLLLPWLPLEWLLSNTILDDAFYYFQTARNIADGNGVTFDGEHLTNGFHPLWMLVNIAVFSLTGKNEILPIHILIFIATLFDIAAAFVVFKIVSGISQNQTLGWGSFFLYILNPYLIQASLNGLESSLALFLLALLIYSLLRYEVGSNSQAALMGAVGGLITLARLDYGIFFVGALAYILWQERRISPVVISGLAGSFFILPWIFWSVLNFGTPIPISGLAYSFTTHKLFYYKTRPLWQPIAWSGLWGWKALMIAFRETGAKLIFAAGVIGAIFFIARAKLQGTLNIAANLRKPAVILTALWLAFFVFAFIQGPIRWTPRPWYFLPFPLLVILSLTPFLENFKQLFYKKRLLLIGSAAILISYIWNFSALNNSLANQLEMLMTAQFIKQNLPEDARIASFNAGIIGYFSNRFVMNADGLINASAFEAMKKNALWEYFRENRISHIADYEITLTYRHKPVLGIPDALPLLEPLATIDIPGVSYAGSVVRVYRINPHTF